MFSEILDFRYFRKISRFICGTINFYETKNLQFYKDIIPVVLCIAKDYCLSMNRSKCSHKLFDRYQ